MFSLDQLDLFAMKEEKKAMILTFGAGGLLCAVLIVSGITLYGTDDQSYKILKLK